MVKRKDIVITMMLSVAWDFKKWVITQNKTPASPDARWKTDERMLILTARVVCVQGDSAP